MDSSNWQNIPFCVEALIKIEPRAVLDIGVGFGFWGMIVREFCDVWFGRVLQPDWQVHIEGIEAFPDNIAEYHSAFYNHIHIGDAREIVTNLRRRWDVVIFGNVLNHFYREDAERLLNWALENSNYVIVDIMLGTDWSQSDSHPYKRHLSEWDAADFTRFCLRRQVLFVDHIDRTFGSFILSRDDPRELALQSFSNATYIDSVDYIPGSFGMMSGVTDVEMRRIIERVGAIRDELEAIKQSRIYRTMVQVRRSAVGRFAVGMLHATRRPRSLAGIAKRTMTRVAVRMMDRVKPVPPGYARLRIIGRNTQSSGMEAWILDLHTTTGSIDLRLAQRHGIWEFRVGKGLRGGPALVGIGAGFIDIPAPRDARLTLLQHPWSGIVEIQTSSGCRRVDLYAPQGQDTTIALTDDAQKEIMPLSQSHPRISEAERRWIVETAQRGEPIAVVNPAWRGIRSATLEQFTSILEVPDQLDDMLGAHYARVLAETGCSIVVIQGFPLTYRYLVHALRRIAPYIKVFVVWHGTFVKSHEDYAWEAFRTVEQFCREGLVWKWGFTKQGMAEIMAARGLRTGFVQNMVRQVPEGPSQPLADGPHIGIWMQFPMWHKLPYEMMAAVSIIPSARLHMSGTDQRIREFAQLMGLYGNLGEGAVDQQQMRQRLASMHLNLYVTFNECAPMLPLESLSVGAPCLIGPTTYYFDDHEYLRERLVVPQSDSAAMIARYAQRALEERDAIITAYREFAPRYNEQARMALSAFLEVR